MSTINYKLGLASYSRQAGVFIFEYIIFALIIESEGHFFAETWKKYNLAEYFTDIGFLLFVYFLIPMILFQGRTIGMLVFNVKVKRKGKYLSWPLNTVRSLFGGFIIVLGGTLWTLSAIFDTKWPFDPIFQCHMYYKDPNPKSREEKKSELSDAGRSLKYLSSREQIKNIFLDILFSAIITFFSVGAFMIGFEFAWANQDIFQAFFLSNLLGTGPILAIFALIFQGRTPSMILYKIRPVRMGKTPAVFLNVLRAVLHLPFLTLAYCTILISLLFGKNYPYDPIFRLRLVQNI